MKRIVTIALLIVALGITTKAQKSICLKSPNGVIVMDVAVNKSAITYSVRHGGTNILSPSPLSLTLLNGEVLGQNPSLKKTKRSSINGIISSPFYKKKEVEESYNQLSLEFKGSYSVEFRAYNDGVAYRFLTSRGGEITVANEEVCYNFSKDHQALIPYVAGRRNAFGDAIEKQFYTSFESYYDSTSLGAMNPQRLSILPLLVSVDDNKKVVITEADLEEYPGMFLQAKPGNFTLNGRFATYPKDVKQGGHNNLQYVVQSRENFIAKTQGTRSFPWRVMVIATKDTELANSDMVYKLATPSRLTDISWIKPGKVAWDWWNDWNISGVDFKSGVNNKTYKYYIDFAAKHKIEYVILDEGWSTLGKADMLSIIPEIDIKELVDYGKQRGVGIVLWAGYAAIEKDMDKICRHYAEMGVKGFKVDFMDRDDQQTVSFYYRLAKVAADHKLMIDFHGAYKPTGLNRTYPNVLNFEGVAGLEQMKWMPQTTDQVKYDVTIPFIRMVAGPMDYTQGAMRNAIKENYAPINSEPMSQGTRCHQLAQYIIFESPFNMLCDSPTNYMREAECTNFIASIPTTWDKTIVLDGKVGEYVAIARQKDGVWYIGASTSWTPRTLTLDLSFLGDGSYEMEAFSDGLNADKKATDYKKTTTNIENGNKLKVELAPGGGFSGVIRKR